MPRVLDREERQGRSEVASPGPPLRMAVVVDDPPRLQAWQRAALEQVRALGCAEVVSAVAVGRQDGPTTLAERLYRACAAARPSAAAGLLPPGRGGGTALEADDLDVVLDLSSGGRADALTPRARYGVWRYAHGERALLREGPPCFWEVVAHDWIIACSLRATLGSGEEVVLHAGRLRAAPTYRATVDQVLHHTSDWVARACQEIRHGGWEALERRPPPGRPRRDPPEVGDWARFGARHARNLVAEVLWTLFCYDEWNVGVVAAAPERLEDLADRTEVRWLPRQGRLRYLADPFVVRLAGGAFLLAERFDYHDPPRGRIARVALGGVRCEVEPVLAPTYHVSYPFVFSDGDATYCLPEAAASGRCDLYRLAPDGSLAFEATLPIDRAVVDPTVFRHAGRWWAMGTDPAAHPSLKLFAYHAERLEGPWLPHALNPLRCDVVGSRPAGPPFWLGGRLYRPAQDCARTYGAALVVNEVEVLTPTAFRERCALRIEPDRASPYPHGTHHLVVDGEMTVFDAKRRKVDPFFLVRQNAPLWRRLLAAWWRGGFGGRS